MLWLSCLLYISGSAPIPWYFNYLCFVILNIYSPSILHPENSLRYCFLSSLFENLVSECCVAVSQFHHFLSHPWLQWPFLPLPLKFMTSCSLIIITILHIHVYACTYCTHAYVYINKYSLLSSFNVVCMYLCLGLTTWDWIIRGFAPREDWFSLS